MLNLRSIRQIGGVGELNHLAVGLKHLIYYAGRRGHQIQIVLSLQPLLNHIQMQQSQESATEAKAQGNGGLRFKIQGCIIELQLFQGIPQVRIFCAVCRIESAIHHGQHLFITGQGLRTGPVRIRYGIAYCRILHIFDGCRDITYHPRRQLLTGDELACAEISYLHHLFPGSGSHHTDIGTFLYRTLHDTAENDNPLVGVIQGIKDQSLQGRLRVSLGGGNLRHHLFQHLINTDAVFRRDQRGVLGLNTDHILNLLDDPLGLCAGQVNLIDDRKYIQVMIQRQIYVCQGLGLYPLGGVHHQYGTVTGRQGTAYLIIEVHMAGCIDQIKNVLLPVLRLIYGPYRLSLDGDTSLPLQLHVIQYLILHLPAGQKSCLLDNTVCQG